MENCIFCKIVNKEIPSTVVYEDADILAFLDIAPVNIGHTLIIPKKHYENIYETPEEMLSNIAKISKKLSIAIKKELNADGINITMNNEKAAGQVIFHSHVHIIPRLKEDGFGVWKGRRPYKEGEMPEVAGKIMRAL